MPSPYCSGTNQFSTQCLSNPNYTPPNSQYGGAVYFPNNPYNTTPVFNPNTSNGSGGGIVSATMTGGGVQVSTGKLNTILDAILSGFALFQKQPYVPTKTSVPQQPQFLMPDYSMMGGYGANSNFRDDGTAAGKVENWVKENTGVVLIGGVVLAAYLMKSPRGR